VAASASTRRPRGRRPAGAPRPGALRTASGSSRNRSSLEGTDDRRAGARRGDEMRVCLTLYLVAEVDEGGSTATLLVHVTYWSVQAWPAANCFDGARSYLPGCVAPLSFVWEVLFFRYGVERHGQTDTTGPGTRMLVKGAGPKHAVKSGAGGFFVLRSGYPGDCIVLAWDARLLPTGRAREVQNELFLRLCIDNEKSIDVRPTCWFCRAMSSR